MPGIGNSADAARGAHKDAAFTEFFRRSSGWTAGDGALSIPLSDGRVLWLFGDSHVDDLDSNTGTMPCLFQTRNAALLQPAGSLSNARTLIGHGPGFRSWFKNSTNENVWFWPLNGFQQGSTIYVYLSSLRKTSGGGKWGFESAGQDVWGKVSFPGLDSIAYSPLPRFNGITFGMGFVRESDLTYAFGGKGHGISSDVFVARFPRGQPEGDWVFWNGRAWTPNISNAVVIARCPSSSVHVCKVSGRFLLTSSAFSVACDQGKDIFVSTSASPTGPFSPRKRVFSVDDTFQNHHPFFYFPIAHPEFINAQNEILFTYSINGYEPCVSSCISGRAIPDHYRPRAFRVPLEELK